MARASAVTLCLIGPLVLACAGSAPVPPGGSQIATAGPTASALPSPTPAPAISSPEPSPGRTVRPTPTSAPSPTATPQLSFSSIVYPYSIVLPADAFRPGPVNVLPPTGTWMPAKEMWDGTNVISPSRPRQNDMTLDSDRDELFIAGHRTKDDLDAFVARMVSNFAMWHGCSPTPASRTTEVDGEPAILIGSMCGRAGVSATAARLFVVHEGFGLVFNVRSFRQATREDLMTKLARYVAEVDLLP